MAVRVLAAGMAETDVMATDAQACAHRIPLLRQQGAHPDGVVGQQEARQELGVVADGRAVVRAQRDDGHAVADALRARPAAVLRDEHAAPEARGDMEPGAGGASESLAWAIVTAMSTMQLGAQDAARPRIRRTKRTCCQCAEHRTCMYIWTSQL